jgi:hypothetical protein
MLYAFAPTPEHDLFPRPERPKRGRAPDPGPGGPDHRVLIVALAVGATTWAMLATVAAVTVR